MSQRDGSQSDGPIEGTGRSDAGGDGAPGSLPIDDAGAAGEGSVASEPDGGERDAAPTDTGDPAQCVRMTQVARGAQVDIYIMLDRSGSMLEDTAAGTTKWDAVRAAISAFVAEPTSAGMGIGLQYFPLGTPGVPEQCTTDAECGPSGGPCNNRLCVPDGDGTPQFTPCLSEADCPAGSTGCVPFGICSGDSGLACLSLGPGGCGAMGDCDAASAECLMFASCAAEDYATPAVQIAPLPQNAAALSDSLAATKPLGLTPTAPALEGALQHAQAQAGQTGSRHVIAVLATDGAPTACLGAGTTADAVDDVVALAADGLTRSPSVETYVIGVFSPDDPSAMQNLERIARAGGSHTPLIVDPAQDVSAQFLSALDAVRMGALSCRFQLPEAPSGRALDLDTVEITLQLRSDTLVLTGVDTPDRCGASTFGWHFAPTVGSAAPDAIELCPDACDALQSEDGGEVALQIACQP